MRRRTPKKREKPAPPSDRHLSKDGRTELAPRHGTRRQGKKQNGVTAATGMPVCRSAAPYSNVTPRPRTRLLNLKQDRPCPPGRMTAEELSSGAGGPTEFSYLQTTSRFLAFLPPGTNSLGLYAPISHAQSRRQKWSAKQIQDGFAGRIRTIVIMTRPWRDDMRRMAWGLSRRLRRVKSSGSDAYWRGSRHDSRPAD